MVDKSSNDVICQTKTGHGLLKKVQPSKVETINMMH